ncbi:MAG: hypothetical protein QMD94_01115 [Candidatus Omnitrophota bacterium]|nr:hypothetical protein [Candidatus Omnitrophota bacterium]
MSTLRGLSIGIGSLPHKEPQGALDLIFKYLPEIPFWPQLPKADICEGMVAQFSEGLPCVKEGAWFNPGEKEKELEVFYEKIIEQDVNYFKITEKFSRGIYAFYQRLKKTDLKSIEFIKCQITGPFTFAASINDEEGRPLLHNPVFMQAIINILKMKALWQIELFKEFGKKIILFIDEPYLSSFGSAYTPLNRNNVVRDLTDLTESISGSTSLITSGSTSLTTSRKDVLIGVHCCGNTDWPIFTDINSIDIINFDAFNFSDKFMLYANDIGAFLNKGGIICWGIIPTQEFSAKETAKSLLEKINFCIDALVKKGVDKSLLLEQLFVSPSCGLGSLCLEKAEKILSLLSETSSLIKRNSSAFRSKSECHSRASGNPKRG